MKKVIAGLLIVGSAAGLAACSSHDTTNTSSEAIANDGSTASDNGALANAGDTSIGNDGGLLNDGAPANSTAP